MITKSVYLKLAPPAAFSLFTARISEWWPSQNRHLDDPASTLHLLESGRFFERATDGREVELGKVRVWETGKRIVLDFYIATGPQRPTEVEVKFDAADAGTRVTVTHTSKPESEGVWTERAPRYSQAWERVLAALAGMAR